MWKLKQLSERSYAFSLLKNETLDGDPLIAKEQTPQGSYQRKQIYIQNHALRFHLVVFLLYTAASTVIILWVLGVRSNYQKAELIYCKYQSYLLLGRL
jgi:hypothetical protein